MIYCWKLEILKLLEKKNWKTHVHTVELENGLRKKKKWEDACAHWNWRMKKKIIYIYIWGVGVCTDGRMDGVW